MERRRVGLVIPALNESATIAGVVAGAGRFGVPIVVDDGSSDETGSRAGSAGATVVRLETNRGYDGALNAGFERAAECGCEFVVTLDADGQHDPNALESFIRALDAGADVVLGVRDRRQRLGESLFGWVTRARWGIRDPLCGLKGYRVGVWRELGHFDCYRSIGTELALFAARQHKSIVQLPLMTRPRADAPRFGRHFAANRRILRALWRGLLGRHGHS